MPDRRSVRDAAGNVVDLASRRGSAQLVVHVAACDACSETLAHEAHLELALREVGAHRNELMAHHDEAISTRRRHGAQSLAAVLVVAAAATLLVVRCPSTPASTSDPNPSGAAQATITVRVAPDHAKIFVDDAPLEGNPANLTLPRDGLAHRVRAEATGYSRKTELVVLDSSSVAVELELEAENKDDEVDPLGNKLTALTFKAVPANSRLYIDNILLPQNPSIAKYPRDGKEHVLRADAPGSVQKTQLVKFDTARIPVTLTLERDAPYVGPTRESRRLRE